MNYKNSAISPTITPSPFCIPDSPPYISLKNIKLETNIHMLKKMENKYGEFLEKKCQILMLLDVIDEIIEIREALIMRIRLLEYNQRKREMIYGYNNFSLFIEIA